MVARRLARLCLGRRRLVPGGAPLARRPRPHRPDRRRARARRAVGKLRVRPASVAGWQPRRAHRSPRWAHRPDRAQPGRRRAAQAGPRSAAEGPTDRRRRHEGRADLTLGRRMAGCRLVARQRLGRGDRRKRDPAAGPVAAAGPRGRTGWSAATPDHRFPPGRPCGHIDPRPRPCGRAHRAQGA